MPGAIFTAANLEMAALTGSFMPGGSFCGANLTAARLADVEWERADLRGADLRSATFHMGSSRSGLLFGLPPSEGSRNGFYTDEYLDQSFRCAEEIRKADLRGADLTGANLEGVDFYLVDLRGATYSARQEDLLRRSGAILDVRV